MKPTVIKLVGSKTIHSKFSVGIALRNYYSDSKKLLHGFRDKKTQVLFNHIKSNESHNTIPSGQHQQEVREMLFFQAND